MEQHNLYCTRKREASHMPPLILTYSRRRRGAIIGFLSGDSQNAWSSGARSDQYRKTMNNWTVCYPHVIRLSSPSKFQKLLSLFRLRWGKGTVFLQHFSPLSNEENLGPHSTPSNYSSHYGIILYYYSFRIFCGICVASTFDLTLLLLTL